jgi:microsomal dipeptidase-like Zn-dependent dipeptidase
VPFLPEGLGDVSGVPAITAGLLARGRGEDEIRKILGENTLHVLAGASGPPTTTRRSLPHGPSETPQ